MSDTGKSQAEVMAWISVKPTAAELREAREREAKAELAQLVAGSIWRKNDRANGLVKVMQRMHHGDSFAIRPVNADGEKISPETAYANAIKAGHSHSVGPYEDARDHIDNEWWSHWEAITGQHGERDTFFRCGC